MRSGLLALAERSARWLPERGRIALYRLGPVTRWLRAALNRAAPKGIHPVRVAAGDLQGMWLLLDLQVDKDLWLGTYEPDVAAALRAQTPPGCVVSDVGANVGYSALLLARAVGEAGRVIAFEPLAANVERLRAAVRLNDLESRIEVIHAAVGAQAGRAEFLRHRSASMGRLAAGPQPSGDFVGAEAVDVVALDAFVYEVGKPSPALVKIDIEGGEGDALRGMRRLLREGRPTLLIEAHSERAAAIVMDGLREGLYRAYTLGATPAAVTEPEGALKAKHILCLPEGVEP